MWILFARAVITSTARASSVSPSSYRSTVFNQSALCVLFIFTCPPRQDKINNFAWLISWLTPLWRGETQTCFTFVISFSYFPICHFRFPIIRVTRRVQFFISAVLLIVEWSMSYLPGPSRRLEPVIKCSPFLSFFQRYIVRDIPLTWDISLVRYFWECSLAHWNLIRHFEKHQTVFWGTTRFPTFTMH